MCVLLEGFILCLTLIHQILFFSRRILSIVLGLLWVQSARKVMFSCARSPSPKRPQTTKLFVVFKLWQQNAMNMHDFLPVGPRNNVTQGALCGSLKIIAIQLCIYSLLWSLKMEKLLMTSSGYTPAQMAVQPQYHCRLLSAGLLQYFKSVPLLLSLPIAFYPPSNDQWW